MAQGTPVRLPALPSPPSHDPQDLTRTGRGSTGGAILAEATVVCGPDGALSFTTMEDSSRSYFPHTGGSPAPGPTMVPVNRLALERRALTQDSYSSRVIAMIQQSRRPSTNRIYDATWRSFCTWCTGHRIDISKVSVPIVLEFLMDGLDRGLAPNTIRRQVAALASVLKCANATPLTHHPMVRSFLKGATNTRPPTVHRYPSWDLHQVLQALTSHPFEPIDTCPLDRLSMKVAFLVAITSARRISELAALSVREDLCTFFPDRVVLRLDPSFIPKVNSLYHRAQEVVLPDFGPDPSQDLERQWNTLDVRRALQYYIKRTAAFRRSEALFVSSHPSTKGRKVSSSTIGRWIRSCIALAYKECSLTVPNNITAHSTRGAATTAAWATQASIEEICRAATWASPSSFIRHYRIDKYASTDASFGRRVLQGVMPSGGTQAQNNSLP